MVQWTVCAFGQFVLFELDLLEQYPEYLILDESEIIFLINKTQTFEIVRSK